MAASTLCVCEAEWGNWKSQLMHLAKKICSLPTYNKASLRSGVGWSQYLPPSMTVHIAASREAGGRAGSKAYRYPGVIAQALVRKRLNPGDEQVWKSQVRLVGLAVSCPKGKCNIHLTNLNHHREGTLLTAE